MIKISYASLSETGNRSINEDSIGALEKDNAYIFALADGLGGHGGGEIASSLVISKTMEVFSEPQWSGDLSLCFAEGQNAVMKEQSLRGQPDDMKTTLVILLIMQDENTNELIAKWGHIGDSRLYVFNKGKYEIRTKDHSVPQMLVNSGDIREKEIRHHPDRNRLLRVMGIEWEEPRYELSETAAIAIDVSYLMCSDGFWELIGEKDMSKFLRSSHTPNEWLERMEEKVKRNGMGKEMDNYSAIAVWARKE